MCAAGRQGDGGPERLRLPALRRGTVSRLAPCRARNVRRRRPEAHRGSLAVAANVAGAPAIAGRAVGIVRVNFRNAPQEEIARGTLVCNLRGDVRIDLYRGPIPGPVAASTRVLAPNHLHDRGRGGFQPGRAPPAATVAHGL